MPIPTLVEVKRSTDTRIRREVIGQMLDYAANAVVYWKVEELITRFEATCQSKNLDAITEIQNLVGLDENTDIFWNKVDTNLKAGKIRLILVADVIPNEMKRIIEFLNGQMNPAEIIGVEIKQFVGKNSKTLVPKVVGQTSAAQSIKSVKTLTKTKRDKESYFKEMLELSGPERTRIANQIFDWVERRCYAIDFGTASYGWGCFIPWISEKFDNKKLSIMPFAIWVKGSVEIYFQHYKNRPPFDQIEYKMVLMKRLNQIEGVNITESALNRRPSFDILLLAKEESYNQFIATFDWFYEQYK